MADAVVVLQDTQVDLRDVAACLTPGGILYYEVNRRRASLAATPGRVWRSLRHLGLSPIGSYAISPHFDSCELYLPLTAPRALEWYMTSLYTAATPRQRLVEMAVRIATGMNSHRFAPFAPYFAVTAISGPARSGAPSVLAHPELAEDLKRHAVHPLLLTDGGNRVTSVRGAQGR